MGPGRARNKRRSRTLSRHQATEGGQALFHAMVDDLPRLLEQLAGAPAKTVAAHNGIPEKPGIYLFREGVNPSTSGSHATCDSGSPAHGAIGAREPSSIGLADRAQGCEGRRTSNGGHPQRPRSGRRVRRTLPRGEETRRRDGLRFIEIDDPVTRTVFEVYAARALGTDEFNSWETH